MKRTVTLLVALALAMSMLAGASAEAEPVPLEIYVVTPWVTSELPPPEEDIYKQYLDEKFGCDVTLSYSADGETTLLTRLTANNPPDLISFGTFASFWKFYEQGALLDDWTPYMDQLQPFVQMMGEDQVEYFTRDGKVTAMGTQPGAQAYAWMIRQDWLENLGLEMPTNFDELYDVLYAFTYNDPDGNGVDDTYGITSAGGGKGVGEISQLILFIDHDNWHVDASGAVSHPVLNGVYQEYLDFVKKLYDAGLIDPNWYTQGWQERKSELFAGKYGMCWYPPDALLDENRAARRDMVADEWWTILPMFSGKLPSVSIVGNSILSVSPQCAQDEAKMQVVIDMMNTFITPNDEYYELRRSANIDGTFMTRNSDGTVYLWRDYENYPYKQLGSQEGSYIACAVYGQVFGTYSDGYFGGETPEPDAHVQRMMELVGQANAMERWSAESQFLALDATTLSEVDMVLQEFAINYIMGADTDYEAFVSRWLDAGGQDLLDDVTEQFIQWGFIEG